MTKQTKGQRDRNLHTTADPETPLHVELATEAVLEGWTRDQVIDTLIGRISRDRRYLAYRKACNRRTSYDDQVQQDMRALALAACWLDEGTLPNRIERINQGQQRDDRRQQRAHRIDLAQVGGRLEQKRHQQRVKDKGEHEQGDPEHAPDTSAHTQRIAGPDECRDKPDHYTHRQDILEHASQPASRFGSCEHNQIEAGDEEEGNQRDHGDDSQRTDARGLLLVRQDAHRARSGWSLTSNQAGNPGNADDEPDHLKPERYEEQGKRGAELR
jgi:hypothetical protein